MEKFVAAELRQNLKNLDTTCPGMDVVYELLDAIAGIEDTGEVLLVGNREQNEQVTTVAKAAAANATLAAWLVDPRFGADDKLNWVDQFNATGRVLWDAAYLPPEVEETMPDNGIIDLLAVRPDGRTE